MSKLKERIWSWGANNTGQLGLGFVSEQVSSPTELLLSASNIADRNYTTKILAIEGGGSHTLILLQHEEDGDTSRNSYEIVSFGLISTKHSFLTKSNFFSTNKDSKDTDTKKITEPQITCGWDMSLYLNSDGTLYSIGDNNYGQLGRTLLSDSQKVSMEFKPVSIDPSLKVIQISAGLRHCVAIVKSEIETDSEVQKNSLIVWGDNSKSQLGLGKDTKSTFEPTRVKILEASNRIINPVKVRCGKYFTIVLSEDGLLFGCGLNKFGIFGQPANCNNGNATVPKFSLLEFDANSFSDISYPQPGIIKDFQCGWNHILVLLEDGRLLSWGRNNFCQLGRHSISTEDCKPNFIIEGLPDYKSDPVISISCGSEHNLILTRNGSIYSWGWNEHDNCGVSLQNDDKVKDFVERPTKVEFAEADSETEVQKVLISCGAGNSFAVTQYL